MGEHRRLFEFSEESRVPGYSEGSENRYALLISRHKLWIMSPYLHGYESRFSSMQRPSSPSQTER